MAGLDDILGGGGQAGKPGKKKNQRMVLVLGGAAVLALIFLLQRRSAAQTQGGEAVTDSAPATPATVADNGEQAAALGTGVTDALAGVSGALSDQATAFQSFSDQLASRDAAPVDAPPPFVINVAPGPVGQINTPTPGKPNAHVNQNKGNPRAGQAFKTRPHKGGGTEHIYPGGKVVVVGAPAKKKKHK